MDFLSDALTAQRADDWDAAYELASRGLDSSAAKDLETARSLSLVLANAAANSKSIEKIEAAIRVLQPSLPLHDRIGGLLLGLGRLYAALPNRTSRSLTRAVESYRQALVSYPRQQDPRTWAAIHAEMGYAFGVRAGRLPVASFEQLRADLSAAQHETRLALEVFQQDCDPEICAELRQHLAWCETSIASLKKESYTPPPKRSWRLRKEV